MAYDFTADSEKQVQLATDLRECATDFDEGVSELYGHIDGLSSTWKGEDYTAFQEGTYGYKIALKDLEESINLFANHFERLSSGTETLANELMSIILNATESGYADSCAAITMPSNGTPKTASYRSDPSNLFISKRNTNVRTNAQGQVITDKKFINPGNVKDGSRVALALSDYSSELENAEYARVDENIFMTITPTTVDGNKCYLTHVVVNDPSQIFGEPANGQYGSGLETATSAAKRLGSGTVLVLNGSHFSYENGTEDLKGANNIVIVNGQIKTNGNAGGMEICLDKNGNLFNATPGTSAQELVNKGVVYTFSSHDSHLISNGSKTYEHQDNAYNSTVIAQKAPCDYYFLTGSTSNYGAADYLYDKGCTFAKSMDQGGSVSLVYNGHLINNSTDSSGERAIGDFLCITD